MRLAKSQAHQPFPGFFKPGFLLSNHRCKSLFQGVCPDSNRGLSPFGQMHSAGALFQRRFFRLAAVFFSKKLIKIWASFCWSCQTNGAAPFFISKRAPVAVPVFVGRNMIVPALFFCTREELYEYQRRRKEPLPQRDSNRPCPRRISHG